MNKHDYNVQELCSMIKIPTRQSTGQIKIKGKKNLLTVIIAENSLNPEENMDT